MDLSQVFGKAPPAAMTGASPIVPPLPASQQNQFNGDGLQQAFETGLEIRDGIAPIQAKAQPLHENIGSLVRAIDSTRKAYEQIVAERDQMRNRLVSAEGRLGEVQKVVHRYTTVQEPVVASDGYTYERAVIHQYLAECEANSVTPLSQLSKSELSQVLVPNQSLKKLVDLLKDVKPREVPPASSPNARNNKDDKKLQNGAVHPSQEGRLHPCIRVYGFCNYGDECNYAFYPYEGCLSHLKGKCRFGNRCHERHVDYVGRLQDMEKPERDAMMKKMMGDDFVPPTIVPKKRDNNSSQDGQGQHQQHQQQRRNNYGDGRPRAMQNSNNNNAAAAANETTTSA